jgi:hypothetical protein
LKGEYVETCRIVGLGTQEKCKFCDNHANIIITFDNFTMVPTCNKCVGSGKIGDIVEFYGNKKELIPKPTIETPIFKSSILIDKEGNFRIKIKDQIKPEKYSYYDDAYYFLSIEMNNFFQTFTESIVKEQHKILNKEN